MRALIYILSTVSVFLFVLYMALSNPELGKPGFITARIWAAKAGDTKSQIYLGEAYRVGAHISRDSGKAIKWYKKAAEGGAVEAYYQLGQMYELGDGVDADPEAAKSWYLKAAKQGHTLAKLSLVTLSPDSEGDEFGLVLENYTTLEDLQDRLETLFGRGTPIEAIDAVLVQELGFFRTNNLILSFDPHSMSHHSEDSNHFSRGTSSDKNFVFYFKPHPSKENTGWKDASDGWVIKAVHGNMPSANDSDFQRSMGGSLQGLKYIRALKIPAIEKSNEEDKSIALVKELLQYKAEIQEVDGFDGRVWSQLVEEHKNSSCVIDFTYQCLIDQFMSLAEFPQPSRRSYYALMAKKAMLHGDRNAAQKLLEAWPTTRDVREEEESYSRLRRHSDAVIQKVISDYQINYMRLLFFVGQYDKAKTLLEELHAELQTGDDYGAIDALISRGDLSYASTIAKETLKWKRGRPDPLRNSSAHGHCQNYTHNRAEAIGRLGLAYLEQNNITDAKKTAELLEVYIRNKAFGQSSFCYVEAAKKSYDDLMRKILFMYRDEGREKEAHDVFDRLFKEKLQNDEPIRRYVWRSYEPLAFTAAKLGLQNKLIALAEFIQEHNKMDYPGIYARATYDPVPYLYALAGEHEKAIRLCESNDYKKSEDAAEKSQPKILKIEDASTADVRLTTYLKIAESLAALGDAENALLYLEKASPYMNHRVYEHDVVLRNLEDYIDKANIYTTLKQKKLSEETFEELLKKFGETTPADFRGGQITAGFMGRFALLFAQHRHISELMTWSETLPRFYAGAYYARIGKLLLDEGRMDEYELYAPEMVRVFSSDKQPLGNWLHLFNALIEQQAFDQFMRFYNSVNKGSQLDHDRQPQQFGTFLRAQRPETKNTPQQIWMMGLLLRAKLKGERVPADVFQQIWEQYIDNCFSHRHALTGYGRDSNIKANEKETMAACYAVLM